jgi:hypothetical protein
MESNCFLKLFISLLVATTVILCDNGDSNNEIHAEITVRMIETLSASQRELQFFCSTVKIYPCCNYLINYKYEKLSNNLIVDFQGINETDICFTALGPATAIINLSTLENGIYNLIIDNDTKNTGQLTVSSDSYEIIFPNSHKFTFINSPLNRIPENTIWGTIGYHKQETDLLVQSFIDSLQILGAKAQPYKSGDYGEFQVNSDGQIVQPGNDSGYYFAKSFIFNYEDDISLIEQLIQNYAINYGEEYLYIGLYTDTGEKFLSWIY